LYGDPRIPECRDGTIDFGFVERFNHGTKIYALNFEPAEPDFTTLELALIEAGANAAG